MGFALSHNLNLRLRKILASTENYKVQPTNIRQPVRVVLVDQSDLVLQRLKTVLSKSYHIVVVGTARTQGEAGVLLRSGRPDVIVLDTHVGDVCGIALCQTIRKSYPQVAVLFFTANDDKRLLRAAVLAGAQGYLLKRASGEAVTKAIEIVAAGQAIVDRQLTQEILKWIRDHKRAAQGRRSNSRSASDTRVLSLIAAGYSNKEIARQLNVTPGVLLSKLRGIYRRLNISRRSEAASYFVRWEQRALGDVIHSARVGLHKLC